MKLGTGLKALIGLSILGIAIAIFLIYTCPFSGRLAFAALVRQVPHAEHPGHGAEQKVEGQPGPHLGPHEKKAEPHERAGAPHAQPAPARREEKGLSVHFMAVPGVRRYPAQETEVFGVEVNPIGIAVLLVLIGLCALILRQRPLRLFGRTLTPKTMGVAVLAITLWNLAFAAFLLWVEIYVFREL
jgi:hypothetical protein